mmetsp:Transcript_86278/g.243648  ORF Transcript_86278/g.243648 Transcript_86278/m.243648 type:complete len:343 (-) Transcript_86278:3-1031(-)
MRVPLRILPVKLTHHGDELVQIETVVVPRVPIHKLCNQPCGRMAPEELLESGRDLERVKVTTTVAVELAENFKCILKRPCLRRHGDGDAARGCGGHFAHRAARTRSHLVKRDGALAIANARNAHLVLPELAPEGHLHRPAQRLDLLGKHLVVRDPTERRAVDGEYGVTEPDLPLVLHVDDAVDYNRTRALRILDGEAQDFFLERDLVGILSHAADELLVRPIERLDHAIKLRRRERVPSLCKRFHDLRHLSSGRSLAHELRNGRRHLEGVEVARVILIESLEHVLDFRVLPIVHRVLAAHVHRRALLLSRRSPWSRRSRRRTSADGSWWSSPASSFGGGAPT